MSLQWEKLKEKEIKVGHRTLLKKTFRLPDGTISDFEVSGPGSIVCMLAVTPKNNVVLVKQYRPGPEKVLLEMPGGGVNKDEDPKDAAKRELLEETGYSGTIRFASKSLVSGYGSMFRYNFAVTNCKKVCKIRPDKTEFLEPVEMSLSRFRKHLKDGALTDISTGYLCLDYLHLI